MRKIIKLLKRPNVAKNVSKGHDIVEFEIYLGEARKYTLIFDERAKRFRQNLPMCATLQNIHRRNLVYFINVSDTDS